MITSTHPIKYEYDVSHADRLAARTLDNCDCFSQDLQIISHVSLSALVKVLQCEDVL